MKKRVYTSSGLILVASASLLCSTPGQCGEGWDPRGFFWLDAGATFLESKVGPPDSDAGADAEFGTGVAFGLGGGFQFNKWIALDLPLEFAWNSIDRFGSTQIDGSFYQLAFIPRVIGMYPIEFSNGGKLVPMVGVGAGGTLGLMDVSRTAVNPWEVRDSDFAFAWELFAGVRYDFNDRTSLALRYSYRGIGDLSLTRDTWVNGRGDVTDEFELKDVSMQTVTLAVTWTF